MAAELTEIQKRILTFIIQFQKHNGYAPNLQEIADYFQMSPQGISGHLKLIRKKGYLDWRPNLSRSLVVRIDPFMLNKIPILGAIAAGAPLLAVEHHEDYLDLAPYIEQDGQKFGVKIEGDSMEGAHILDGDIAIIQRQPTVENRQIAAVRIGDEVTLKRVDFSTPGEIALLSENPQYPPMTFSLAESQIEILGKYVGLIHRE